MEDDKIKQDTPVTWYRERPVWVMLFLGFSAGVPLYLVFGSLSLWLREAGVDRSTVTFFSWAVLGYSFKWIWAPLIDTLPLPWLTQCFGRRRGWLLLSQLSIIASIVLMACSDPADGLFFIALGSVLLGFSSATQDIVIDAYRIESAVARLQALLSSTYVAGYRIGMMVAGAWALLLAEGFGSTADNYLFDAWQKTYLIMATVMCVGVITTLIIKEPAASKNISKHYSSGEHVRFFLTFLLSVLAFCVVYSVIPSAPLLFNSHIQPVFGFLYGSAHLVVALLAAFALAKFLAVAGWVNVSMVYDGYIEPIKDFLSRYGKLAVWVLLLVGFYRVSDIVLGVITNVFYLDMGYSKSQIASITKILGVVVTIIGAVLGGVLTVRIGVMRALMLGAILVAITNMLFVWLSVVGKAHTIIELPLLFVSGEAFFFPLELCVVIVVDNLAQGFAVAAFLGWLSSLTNISFSATQYAVFSSLMTLVPKLLGGYTGTMVDLIGYNWFFLFASLLGLPVIVLVWYVGRRLR